MPLNLLPYGVVGLALLIGAGGGYYVARRDAAVQAAADQATLASRDRTIEALRRQTAKRDTVLVIQDSVRIRTEIKWREKVDSIPVDRPVPYPVFKEVVVACDSAVGSCKNQLKTSTEQIGDLRTWIRTDSATIRALSRENGRLKLRRRLGCTIGPSFGLKGGSWAGISCGLAIF